MCDRCGIRAAGHITLVDGTKVCRCCVVIDDINQSEVVNGTYSARQMVELALYWANYQMERAKFIRTHKGEWWREDYAECIAEFQRDRRGVAYWSAFIREGRVNEHGHAIR